MARNKHPEETVNLILDVAFRLFRAMNILPFRISSIIWEGSVKVRFIIILNQKRRFYMLL